MARFRRWYRRRYGVGSYRRLRRYRRRYRKFVNGSSRSRCRVKIPVTVNASLTVPQGDTLSNVVSITPFFSNQTESGAAKGCLIGSVLGAPLYTAYSGLYDQVKLDGFKLNFSITSGIGPGGTFPSLSVYTAVDRKFQQSDFNTAHNPVDGSGYPRASNLKESSSYLAAVALNNSITKMQRSCYASDLFEKANFTDCDWSTTAVSVNGVGAQNVRALRTQPAFNPAMFFAVDSGSSVDANVDRVCTVVIEIMYYLTFRNPKYGGGSTAAKSIEVPYGINLAGVRRARPDDDGDMDDAAAAVLDDLPPGIDFNGDMDDAPEENAGAASAAAADPPQSAARTRKRQAKNA